MSVFVHIHEEAQQKMTSFEVERACAGRSADNLSDYATPDRTPQDYIRAPTNRPNSLVSTTSGVLNHTTRWNGMITSPISRTTDPRFRIAKPAKAGCRRTVACD